LTRLYFYTVGNIHGFNSIAAKRAQRILEFCQPSRTREEIQAFIKIKDREYFRKNFLQPLLKQGLLKPTIPDKPTSSKQKYYATKEKKIR
jgi:ATP-dependent DNA helicase RecG